VGEFFAAKGARANRKIRVVVGLASPFDVLGEQESDLEEAGMARTYLSSPILKSIAGRVLAGGGLFILLGNLDGGPVQVNHLLRTTARQGLVMLASSFNHKRGAWSPPVVPIILAAAPGHGRSDSV